MPLTVLEICTGGGGQAIGLETAGYEHIGAIENDRHACNTLRANRPFGNVLEKSVTEISSLGFRGIDLLAGGVPCPPFSIAGKQLGKSDERDLFPEAIRLISEARPKAVLLENVPGFASSRFEEYRRSLFQKLRSMGYEAEWEVLNAASYGVAQLRPRFVLVAFRDNFPLDFAWPRKKENSQTVGTAISDLMGSRGWPGTESWSAGANSIAPTLVGGSKKHGGPDLGPTRARKQWAALGVDGLGIANEPPGPDCPLDLMPRLTVAMAARIQGFPDSWKLTGGKTAAYRQVGNAFPPPVALVVGNAIASALDGTSPTMPDKRTPYFSFAK